MIRRPPRSTLFSLHDALPISPDNLLLMDGDQIAIPVHSYVVSVNGAVNAPNVVAYVPGKDIDYTGIDRKSTRLNSSHMSISYAVFCLKKKKNRPPSTKKKSRD